MQFWLLNVLSLYKVVTCLRRSLVLPEKKKRWGRLWSYSSSLHLASCASKGVGGSFGPLSKCCPAPAPPHTASQLLWLQTDAYPGLRGAVLPGLGGWDRTPEPGASLNSERRLSGSSVGSMSTHESCRTSRKTNSGSLCRMRPNNKYSILVYYKFKPTRRQKRDNKWEKKTCISRTFGRKIKTRIIKENVCFLLLCCCQ